MRINFKFILLSLAIILLIGQVLAQESEDNPDTSKDKETSDPNDKDDTKDKDETQDKDKTQDNPPDGTDTKDKTDDDDDDDDDGKNTDNQPPLTEPVEIKIGQYYQINRTLHFNDSYQAVGYFYFKTDKKLERKDLEIQVSGRQDFRHNPALFYSTVNKFPDLSNNNDVVCGLNGHDFCLVPADKVKNDQIYYIGVHCIYSCRFELHVQYENAYIQKLNDQVVYESNKDKSYLLAVQITLPKDLDDKIEHILLESFILNFNMVNSNFHMYVNKGTKFPTPASYEYITEEMKLNGQSILLERGVHKFAANDTYSISIDIPPKAKILVKSESFERVRTIFFYKSVDDMVRKGQVRIFRLEISPFTLFEWDKEELSIDLEPYFGNPDLYVIHGQLPDDPTDLSKYQWSSTEQDGQESLTITKGAIDNKSNAGDIFYIAVYGESAASFRILTYSSSIDQRSLLFNAVENGYAVQNEIVQYQLSLQDEIDEQVSLKLSTLQGEGQLFMKRCLDVKSFDDCLITMDDIKNTTAKEPAFYRSQEESKQHRIKFDYKKSDCIDSKEYYRCTFIIGVLGISKVTTKYRLLAKHTITPTQLRENEDHRSFLLESEREYYKFSINQEDASISKVEFSITAISGELAVYSSRNSTQPKEADHYNAEVSSQDLIVYHKNQQNPTLKGSYYVCVQAISGCIYAIHVKIYRQSKDKDHSQSNMKLLHLGNVEKGYLSYKHPVQFYFYIEPNENEKIENHQSNVVLYFNAYKDGQVVSNMRIDPTVQIQYHLGKDVSDVARQQDDFISSDFVYMKIYTNFTDPLGKYVITLTHDVLAYKELKIKYQLNVNANNIIYIVPRSAYIQDLSQTGLDNYELYLNEAGKVYLEIFECFGRVKVQASSSIDNIEKNIFDVKSTSPSRFIGDHTIVNYEKDKKGPLYFSVKPTTGNNNATSVQSLYMLIPHILSKNQVSPHEIFSTPAEGQIETEVSFAYEGDKLKYISQIKITFGTIECVNDCVDSVYTPKSYTYFVHVTNKDTYMQYFAKCNMESSILKNLGFNDTGVFYQKVQKNIKGSEQPNNITEIFKMLPNGTYYAEVMGVVFLETSYTKGVQEPFTFIYPMKQFVVGSTIGEDKIIEKTEEKYILPLWILVPVGLALLVLIIRTYIIRRRYQIAMAMQDKNPEEQEQQKDDNINDDDERKSQKKVDKINFLN